MTGAELAMLERMEDYDSLEPREGFTTSKGIGAKLGNIVGNPNFKAQFNLQINTSFYDATGAAVILPAALPASLQVNLPIFVFGKSDFEGGFNNLKSLLPFAYNAAGNWAHLTYGVWGKDTLATILPATVLAMFPNIKLGDLITVFTATVAGNDYYGAVLISCPQVSYGTLLDSISSDLFILNMIRYKVDPLQLDQLNNQIMIVKQTLFGKSEKDYIDPNTYVTGGTYNQNISDIPIELLIDKNKSLLTSINYDVQDFVWTCTVFEIKRPKI